MPAIDEPRIYEVRSRLPGGHVLAHGSFRSRGEADRLLREQVRRIADSGGSPDGCWVETIDTTGLFELPPRPTPRERYTTRTTAAPRKPGIWEKVHVDVLDGDTVIAGYDRNYSMLGTFEPFRQGGRDYALISPHYTATSVMDLSTGEIIAAEEPSAGGFCPVGFYVPDWWDVHRGSDHLPGSMHWRPADHEWPSAGDFGFVWGCVWGDDSSWKVQHLDLSGIRAGVLRRDDRFGYVKLASDPKLVPQDFIRCSSWQGERRVQFYVEQNHSISTGRPIPDEDW